MFMKIMRGIVVYWKDVLFNLIVMLKNLGCLIFFMIFFVNDYYWKEFVKILKVFLENLLKVV